MCRERIFYIDLPSEDLSGITMVQLLQQVGQAHNKLYGITAVNNGRPTADPRSAFFFISSTREGGAMNWGIRMSSRYNNGVWEFLQPLVIPKGHFLRMTINGETGDSCNWQYAATEEMKDLGRVHS